MPTRKRAFLGGARAISPILLGLVPFGLIAGIAAVKVGFTKLEALGMSYIVFAGAAQLAAVHLIGRHAPVAVVILTALIVNLRLCMYSASLAPHFNGLPLRGRGLLAYLLTDQAYAVSIVAYSGERRSLQHWFYHGAALTLSPRFDRAAPSAAALVQAACATGRWGRGFDTLAAGRETSVGVHAAGGALRAPLRGIGAELNVAIRTGDTPTDVRRSMERHPSPVASMEVAEMGLGRRP